VVTKLNMSWQCVLVVEKVEDILGSIRKSGGSRLREVILSLCSVLVRLI